MPKPLEIFGKIIAWILTILGASVFLFEIFNFRSWINDLSGPIPIVVVISLLMFGVGIAIPRILKNPGSMPKTIAWVLMILGILGLIYCITLWTTALTARSSNSLDIFAAFYLTLVSLMPLGTGISFLRRKNNN